MSNLYLNAFDSGIVLYYDGIMKIKQFILCHLLLAWIKPLSEDMLYVCYHRLQIRVRSGGCMQNFIVAQMETKKR